MAADETLTQTYTITVSDGLGGTLEQDIVLTLTGTNDAPTVNVVTADVTETLIEIADNADGENASTLDGSGSFAIADVDLADTHAITFTASSDDYLGTFEPVVAVDTTDTGSGRVDWSFTVDDRLVDHLGEGDTLTQTYTVTVSDGHGGTVDQDVVITLEGTNDAPLITGTDLESHVVTGGVTEMDDLVEGEGATDLSDTGSFTFEDVDFSDEPTVFVVEPDESYRGTLTPLISDSTSGDGTGQVDWIFTVNDSLLDDLAQDQTLTQTYTVRISDGSGGTVDQEVVITLTGTNDAPVITVADDEDMAGVIENEVLLHETGSFSFADVDLTDRPTATFTLQSLAATRLDEEDNELVLELTSEQQAELTAAFSIAEGEENNNNGQIDWSYEIEGDQVSFLSPGEQATAVFTITVDDDNGGIATETVTIRIDGHNLAPEIHIEDASTTGAITETDVLSQTGTFDFTDANLNDRSEAAAVLTATAVRSDDSVLELSEAQQEAIADAFTLDHHDDNSHDGTVDWDYTIEETALDFLAASEVITATFTVTLADRFGGTAEQDIVLTLTGTNDAPTLVVDGSNDFAGSVTEVVDLADEENDSALTDSGSFQIEDLDLTDVHTVTFTASAEGYLGVFEPTVGEDTTGDSSGRIDWSFSVDDGSIDYLAADETLTQTYTITVSDGLGGTLEQDIVLTLTGTNDAPTVNVATADVTETLVEIADGADGENTSTLDGSGSFAIADVDLADTHAITFTASSDDYLGTFEPVVAVDTTDTGSGRVDWSFTVDDSLVDYLGEGDSLTQTYTVTVSDGQGGTVDQDVVITLEGTNDAPTLTGTELDSHVVTGGVTEVTDLAEGENTTDLSDTGSFTFSDVDLSDEPTIALVDPDGSYLGTFTPLISNSTTDDGEGQIDWTFTVNDSLLDDLAQDQTLTQTYTVRVSDGSGGTVDQDVVITLTGTNDVATITGTNTDTMTEDQSPSELIASGTFFVTDDDAGQSSFVEIRDAFQTYGSFTVETDGRWTYTVDNTRDEIQSLGMTETLTETLTIESFDGSATETLVITIQGTNDSPDLVVDTDTGRATIEGSEITGLTTLLSNDSDVDVNDELIVSRVNGNDIASSGDTVIEGDFGNLSIAQDGSWTYTPTAQADIDLDRDLVAHWTFDEGNGNLALDSGSAGTESDNVTLGSGTSYVSAGSNDSALEFDGSSTGATFIQSDDVGQAEDKFTLYFEFQLSSDIDLNRTQVLYEQGGSSHGYNVYIHQGYLYAGAWGTTNGALTSSWIRQDISTLDSSEWHRVGLVLDTDSGNSGTLEAWFDGQSMGVSSHMPPVPGHSNGSAFGYVNSNTRFEHGYDSSNNYTFNGRIDEARIYQRALSHQEINALSAEFENGTLQDVFEYTVSDETDESTSTLTIDVNRTPEALSGTISTVTEDHSDVITGSLSVIDRDAGEVLTFELVSEPSHGTVTINSDGSYEFNLNSDFQDLPVGQQREVSFVYRVTDSQGDSSTNTISLTVTGVNDAADIQGENQGEIISTAAESYLNLTGDGASAEIQGLESGGAMTLAGWVRFDDISNRSWERIFDFGDGQANNNIVLGHANTSSDLRFEYIDSSSTSRALLAIDDFFVEGEWVHVAATIDSSGNYTIYKNGQEEGSIVGEVPPVAVRQNNLVGDINRSSFPATDGALDQLLFVDRDLSSSEISELYRANFNDFVESLSGDDVHAYDFEGSDGNTATDIGDNSLPITLTNADILPHSEISAFGSLAVTDVDIGEASFQSETLTGSYGELFIDAEGRWHYTVERSQADIRGLNDGETLTETITVRTLGGDNQDISITIHGSTEPDLHFNFVDSTDLGYDSINDVRGSWSGAQLVSDGEQGNVLRLDSANDYLRLNSGYTMSAEWTISVDYKNLQVGPGNWNALARGVGSSDLHIVIQASTGELGVHESGEGFVGSGYFMSDGDDQWRNLAVVGGGGQTSFYIDGELVGTSNYQSTDSIEFIGGDDASSIYPFAEYLSDFRIYNQALETDSREFLRITTGDETLDAQVVEDTEVVSDELRASGTVFVADVDSGENGFVAEDLSGTYGSLSIDASGQWQYAVSNNHQAVQALGEGETLIDSITVHTEDGLSHTIDIAINGINDAAEFGGENQGGIISTAAESYLNFTGAGSVADVPGLESGGAMTFAGWVRYDTFTERYSRIFDFGNGQPDNNILLGRHDVSSDLLLASYDGAELGAHLILDDFFTEGEWTHVAITINNDGLYTVYQDGAWAGEVTGTVPEIAVRTNNYIGASNWTNDGPIDGAFDQLLVVDRALTSDEVSRLYQSDFPDFVAELSDDQVHAYDFEGSDGNTASDIGSNSHPMTLTGTNLLPHSELSTFGTLTVTDTDTGQASFQSETLSGAYGELVIDTEGNWSYTSERSQSDIRALNDGETLIDTITVRSLDGTTHDIDVTLHGSTAPDLHLNFVDSTDLGYDPVNNVRGNWQSGVQLEEDADQGNVMRFDHTDDYLALDSDYEVGSAWTISVNFKNPMPVNGYSMLVRNNASDGHVVIGSDGELGVLDREPSNTTIGSGYNIVDNSSSDEWHNLVAIGANGETRFYIDGIHVGTSAYQSTESIRNIGGDDSRARPFAEYLSDFRIYNQALDTDSREFLRLTTGEEHLDAQLTEDDQVTSSELRASGSLFAIDVDAGENGFVAEELNATHGSLSIDANGHWQYAVSNNLQAIQALGVGESLVESFTVRTVDGLSHTIDIAINGTNDLPSLVTETNSGEVSTGGAPVSGDNLFTNAHDQDDDTLSITEVNGAAVASSGNTVIEGDFGDLTIDQNGDWTYTSGTIDIDTGLVAYWNFDDIQSGQVEDLATAGTFDDTGTLSSGATSVDGVNNNAVNFDGSSCMTLDDNSYDLNYHVAYSGSERTHYTVNLEFQLSSDSDISSRQVIYKQGGSTRGYNIYIDDGRLYVGGWESRTAWGWLDVDLRGQDLMAWHQVALVLDTDENNNTTLEAWFNGESLGAVTGEPLSDHGFVSLGGSNGSARYHDGTSSNPYYFNGSIDEVRVYNRALSHQEINALEYEFETGSLQDVFNYTVSDGTGTSDSTLTIDVNRTPEAGGSLLSITEDDNVIMGQVDVVDLDTDEVLSYLLESSPTQGTLTFNADGSYVYYPGDDFQHLDSTQSDVVSFTYRVTDSQGASATNTVTIEVAGVNDVATVQGVSEGELGAMDAENYLNFTGEGSIAEIQGIETGGSMTFAAWVRYDTFDQGFSRVFDFGDGQEDNNILLGRYDETSTLMFESWEGSSRPGRLSIENFFEEGEWVHVVATIDDSGLHTVYRNGEFAGSAQSGVPPVQVRANNLIGESNWAPDGPIDGAFDQILIVDRDLSAEEASRLYLNEFSSFVADLSDDEVHAYDFEGVDGGMAPDLGSNSLPMSLTNTNLLQHSTLSTTGTLTVTDTDTSEVGFQNETVIGTYGELTIDAQGNWSYTADRGQANIQALNDGETLTESIVVRTLEGATHNVVITINGITTPDLNLSFLDSTDLGYDPVSNVRATFTSGVQAAVDDERGNVLNMSANGDYLRLETSHALSSGWTISVNYKNLPTSSSSWSGLVRGAGSSDTHIIINNSTGELGTFDYGPNNFHGSGYFVNRDDQWHNLTVIGESGKTSFYIDGRLVGVSNYQSTDSIEMIGGDDSSSVARFAENLSDFRVYNQALDTDSLAFRSLFGNNTTEEAVFEGELSALGLSGSLTYSLETDVTEGSVIINSDGSYSFDPGSDFQNLAERDWREVSFVYRVSDGSSSATETVTITVSGVNDEAVITGDSTGTLTEDSDSELSISGSLLVADDEIFTRSIEVVDSSFEEMAPSDNTYTYSPSSSGWTFSDDAGLQDFENSSVFATTNDGENIAYMNNDGSTISQTLSENILSNTDYQLQIDIAGRVIPGEALDIHYEVRLVANGHTLASSDQTSLTASDTGFNTLTVNLNGSDIPESALGHPITIEVVRTNDLSQLMIDNVRMEAVEYQTGFNQETIEGNYGSLEISNSGQWTYSANNSQDAIQSLNEGDSLVETITVESIDGTAQDIVINIGGVRDIAVINNDDLLINEDQVLLRTAGTLTVTDADAGEDGFIAATLDGTYGRFTVDAFGNWSYTGDDSTANFQALGDGDTLTDIFTVTSIEGTTQSIAVRIVGSNDAPDLVADFDTGNAILEGDSFLGDFSLLDNDSDVEGDSLTLNRVNDTPISGTTTIEGAFGELDVSESGSWTYRPSDIDLDSNLLNHWRFDEESGSVASDSSTTGVDSNDISLNSGASFVDSGLNGGAVEFNSSTSQIHLTESNDLNNLTRNEYSVHFSFQLADDFNFNNNNEQVLFEQGGITNGYNVYIKNSSLYIGAWSDSNGWYGSWLSVDISNIDLSQWHQVALVLNSDTNNSGTFEAWFNGDSLGLVNDASPMAPHGDGAFGDVHGSTRFSLTEISSSSSTRGYSFEGLIDEARVYDRALSHQEINALSHEFETGTLQDEFTYAVSDGSAESTSTLTINVNQALVAGTSDGEILEGSHLSETLRGAAGDDTIYGGAEADVLDGGAGNDILIGGSGSDTFIWHIDDLGTTDAPAEDTIVDFSLGQGGDVLDLSDVLIDDESQLDQYLSFSASGDDTILEISNEANGSVTQKVTLQGVQLSSLGSDNSEIINNLLNDGNLQVD